MATTETTKPPIAARLKALEVGGSATFSMDEYNYSSVKAVASQRAKFEWGYTLSTSVNAAERTITVTRTA